MPTFRFARVPSLVGPLWVAESGLGVAACSRADSPEPMLAGLHLRFPGATFEADAVEASWALSGSPPPSLDLRGLSPFDAAVYQAVAGVPPGATLTYGEIAAIVGSPGAARAVGGALARCPLFPAVPCHRIVRASDGWSGWGGDPALKRRLLVAERRGR